MDTLTRSLNGFTLEALRWSSPGWWVCVALIVTTLTILHVLPLRIPLMKEDEYSLGDVVRILARKALLGMLAALILVFWPTLYFAVVGSLAPTTIMGHDWFKTFLVQQAWAWGWLIPAGIVAGVATRALWSRYLTPRLSKLKQKVLVRQENHLLSDIRSEVGKLKTRDFEPRRHYRDGELFVGLGAEGEPNYLSSSVFRQTHMQIVGPTRFGKGVVLGVMLDQAIAQGHAVVYIDPKADAFLPYIMAAACERAGRRFVYIDLNSEDTRWAPFEGGSDRDRRSRIVNCFGLNNTGDGSDFYKSKERAILDTILPTSGSSIAGLRSALEQRGHDGKPLKEYANRLADGLTEFAALPSLNPKKGGGNKIGEAIKSGASIYVRGSLDDPTVRRATQVFIAELIQEARRLAPERSAHLTLAIDELKFMISQEVSDALATIAGFKVNMVLLHQSIKDLRSPEDRSLNVQALESGVLVNCQVKLMYRASDPETAEWASQLSGTKVVRVTKSQVVEHNRYGGEAFKNERTLADLEVPVITMNEMLSLSPRVGVLYVPERLASVLYTCFVPADTQRVLFARPKEKVAALATGAPARGGADVSTPTPSSSISAAPKPVTPPAQEAPKASLPGNPLQTTALRSTAARGAPPQKRTALPAAQARQTQRMEAPRRGNASHHQTLNDTSQDPEPSEAAPTPIFGSTTASPPDESGNATPRQGAPIEPSVSTATVASAPLQAPT